jgi:hypothetical protein
MTNAEVLHQVEHGYRMQAPQVGMSERFYFYFSSVHWLGGKCRSFYSCIHSAELIEFPGGNVQEFFSS